LQLPCHARIKVLAAAFLARFPSENRVLVNKQTTFFPFVDFPTKRKPCRKKTPPPGIQKGFVSRLQVANRA